MKIALIPYWNYFSPSSFGGKCFLEESYEKMQKNSNFDNFKSALYSKSGSMPLTLRQLLLLYLSNAKQLGIKHISLCDLILILSLSISLNENCVQIKTFSFKMLLSLFISGGESHVIQRDRSIQDYAWIRCRLCLSHIWGCYRLLRGWYQ